MPLTNTHHGVAKYGREELVAEMGAAFLGAEAGISPEILDNQAAYLDHWIHAIKGDPKMLITAGAQAQKAVDYILDRHFEVEVAA